MVSLSAIRAAADRVAGVVRRTAVVDVSEQAGRPLVLKCEQQQPGGAFKIRGATNMLMRLSAADLARGVITYSSGNHGQALALAASRLGSKAVVVMPVTAPAIKIDGVRRWGAEVILAGACVVRAVLTKLGCDSLVVSDRGLRHGLIADRFALGPPSG